MSFEPWTSEPSGPEFCYLTRWSHPDGTSARDFQWPKIGYVECPDWDNGRVDPGGTQLLEHLETIGGPPLRQAWKYDGPGLWGWLHGGRYPEVCFIRLLYLPLHQILTVARSELREGCAALDEFRAPRAWVKYSGTLDHVTAALDSEGTEYAQQVKANLIARAKFRDVLARKMMRPSTYELLYGSGLKHAG